ncbi:MAG: hypothetical protein HY928_17755 [Elusimicrobia bacterium]|nr:hypothetical protein [Elusimicrobiota bacterium]
MTPAPLAVLLLLCSAAGAKKDAAGIGEADARAEVTNAEMLDIVKSVSDSNLENAMSKARGEAEKAAAYILQLAASLSAQSAALASEAPGAYKPDLASFLEAAKAFRRAAGECGLEVPAEGAPRQIYSTTNRRADLTLAHGFSRAADAKRKGVVLPKADKAAALRALEVAERASQLVPKTKLDPRLVPRLSALTADADALKLESLALERALHLDAHAQASFDELP